MPRRAGCPVAQRDHLPHPPQKETTKAANKVVKLVSTYRIDAIAIGNGTASRETERFIANLRYEEVKVFVVSGAAPRSTLPQDRPGRVPGV